MRALFRHFSVAVFTLSFASAMGDAHASVPGSNSAAFAPRFKSPFVRGTVVPKTALLTVNGYGHVTADQYKDLRNGAQVLLKRFPADKHYFVGLGRDPAPIIAFLQNLGGKDLAVNFPASSNGAMNAGPKVFAKYVTKIIPAEVLASGRTIVFVDVTSSARALEHYVPLLEPHLLGAKVIRVAFSDPSHGLSKASPGTTVISTANFPEIYNFMAPGGIYENSIAEFNRHVPGSSSFSELNAPRKTYQKYRGALLKRMQADEALHGFLMEHGGTAFIAESPAEAARREAANKVEREQAEAAAKIAEEAKLEGQRVKQEKQLAEAKDFPNVMKKTIEQLVASLPPREEAHEKGYLSGSGKKLNDWLKQSITAQGQTAKILGSEGEANLVVRTFMDKVEEAREASKIRNRDYRRLMGHAMSYAKMDQAMLSSLAARFETSEHFQREITDESEYYLGSHAEKAREETVNMAASFKKLMKALSTSAMKKAE